jgi:HK97 family phage major capsid protein
MKKLAESLEEIQSQMSDLRSKQKPAISAVTDEQQQLALKLVAQKSIASFFKGKQGNSIDSFFTFVKDHAEQQIKELGINIQFKSKYTPEQIKTLNLTTAAQGGMAVAEILARDIMDYAREFSPVLENIGRKPSMTRNFRQLVRISYPSVQEGIENVAGTAIPETSTSEFAEVKSNEFKLNMSPRITDEAMYGSDIDLYNDLVTQMGEDAGIYLAAQVLFGNGTGKNCRGILSSNRVNITATTGESWKPTLGVGRRSSDYYPVAKTGVSGAIGADSNAIVNFVIDTCNKLPTKYLKNAKWYMNRQTKGLFEKTKDADGKPLFMYSYIEGLPGMRLVLNGFPVVIDDTLPNVAANSLFAIFGDLSQAFYINNGDIDKLLLDPYTAPGCTKVIMDKEMFEMVGKSDAILVCAATANAG